MPRQMPVPPPVISATRSLQQIGLKHRAVHHTSVAVPPASLAPSTCRAFRCARRAPAAAAARPPACATACTTGASVSTAPSCGCVLREQHVARGDLRMRDRLAHRSDAAARHVVRLQTRGQLVDGERLRRSPRASAFSAARLATRSVLVVKRGSSRRSRPLDGVAEPNPQARVRDRDDDQPVLRAQRLVGRDRQVIVADARRIVRRSRAAPTAAAASPTASRRTARCRRAGRARCACRSMQRQQNALRRVQAGEIVGDRDADARRRAVGKAGHVHDAGLALNHRVVAGQLRVAARSGRSRRSSSRSAAG